MAQAAARPRSRTPGLRTPRLDIGSRPFLVLAELTRACDLAGRHCRAEAMVTRHPDELDAAEWASVLDDLASLGAPRPIVVLTGGDPFKRDDVIPLIAHGADRGLAMAVSPSGTPLATSERLADCRRAGARVVSFSIDGASASSHDAFRGVEGSYDRILQACDDALDAGLKLQINTTVTAGTVHDLPGILELVRVLGANLWSVFFLVAIGRGRELAGDGKCVVFVSHLGEVSPSGFLPLVVGNVREVPLTSIYRQSKLLRALRHPDRLGGRCRRCQYRAVCGGSRARTYATSGDPLAEDPGCP